MPEDKHEIPSFDEVAEDLTKPLERYLKRFVGDPGITEDLLQETLLRISKALPGFQGRSSIKNWAFTVATNTAIDHIRKTKKESKIVEIEDSDVTQDDLDLIGERLIIDEMSSCVRDEIDSLPEDYRAAIILHDLEGLTAAEAAQISGCSLATAKIRIHRARARLKKALQKDCTFYHDRNQVLRCDRKTSDEE